MPKVQSERSVTFAMPAGRYWIGDPSHILTEKQLEDWTHESGDAITTLDGFPIVVLHTDHGDGIYPSNVDFKFGVDVAAIACIPVALASAPHFARYTYPLQMKKPFACYRTGTGRLIFGPVQIETAWPDDEPTTANGHDETSDTEEVFDAVYEAATLVEEVMGAVREEYVDMITDFVAAPDEYGPLDEPALMAYLASTMHTHAAALADEDIAELPNTTGIVVASHKIIDELCRTGVVDEKEKIICSNSTGGLYGPAYEHYEDEQTETTEQIKT